MTTIAPTCRDGQATTASRQIVRFSLRRSRQSRFFAVSVVRTRHQSRHIRSFSAKRKQGTNLLQEKIYEGHCDAS
jgi:hypothetical protein